MGCKDFFEKKRMTSESLGLRFVPRQMYNLVDHPKTHLE